MATQFKNLYTTLSTSSSTAYDTKDLLTCPVGKTILIRTVHHHNSTTDSSGNNHSMHALWFRDYSASSYVQPLTMYLSNALAGTTATLAKGAALTFNYPLVMEENDELKLRISEPNQDISLAYIELDTGIKQRYKAVYTIATTTSASGGTFDANVLLAPAGTTYIVNFFTIYNGHSHTQEFKLTVKDNSANITKTLWDYDFQQNGRITWQQAIVLEASDQLILTSTWDTDDSATNGGSYYYISYLEIRNPPIRA